MKTRTKACAASIFIGVVIAGIVIALGLRSADFGERRIEGRPLADWVRDLGDAGKFQDARTALVRQGPAIIPNLLRSIREMDRFPSRLQDAVAGTRLGKRLQIKRNNRQMIRGWLIFTMCDIAAEARYSAKWENELRMAADVVLAEMENNPQRQNMLLFRLGNFGEHAKMALPTLIAMCRSNYPQAAVFHALAEIGPDAYAAEVVSVATNFISSSDVLMSSSAMQALGACGTNATAAIPQLLSALDKDGPQVNAALLALAQIGSIPRETQPKLEEFLHFSKAQYSANAALAVLRIDTNVPAARAVVESRLHPIVSTNLLMPMVISVSRIPEIARQFEPQLRKLALKTNLPSSDVARFALKRIAQTN